jgi:hypothetical protein
MLAKLNIPAGVYANGTDYQSQGRWHMANLVRWQSGYMGPVKGWQLYDSMQLSGRPSDIHTFRDGLDSRAGIGTHLKLYAIKPGGDYQDITPVGYVTGRADAVNAFGYGLGRYGRGAYGVSSPATGTIQPSTNWTLDNFGSFLVACANTDGKLYYWDNITATATVMTGAPIDNEAVVVSEERFVFALGAAGNNKLIQWSDQEDFNTWMPAPTNQAGDIELATNGAILNAIRVRGQLLILTTADAHTATYQGAPFVYGFERVGSGCGAAGPQASVATDSFACWMGLGSFYIYDGFVKPLPSDVQDYVFSDINMAQIRKVAAWNNTAVNEVWWHYPSSDSVECNRYVAWNYRENTWTIGLMNRACGDDNGVYANPLMASPDGYIYRHEIGYLYDGAVPYAETGPIEIGDGDNRYMVRRVFPDERTKGDVNLSFRLRNYPNGPEYSFGPYSIDAPTSVRFSGRQMVMRVDAATNSDWRFGIPRLDIAQGGTR